MRQQWCNTAATAAATVVQQCRNHLGRHRERRRASRSYRPQPLSYRPQPRNTAATVVQHCRNSGATVVQQWCNTAATVVQHCRNSDATLPQQWCNTAATVMQHRRNSGATPPQQLPQPWCNTAATAMLHCRNRVQQPVAPVTIRSAAPRAQLGAQARKPKLPAATAHAPALPPRPPLTMVLRAFFWLAAACFSSLRGG